MTQQSDEREVSRSEGYRSGVWSGVVLAGTYRVGGRLGKGGMGEVHQAEHLRLGKTVAVKFMNTDRAGDPRALQRFRREVRALATITNEHVVTVFDCGELEGEIPYVVMERLEGEDLRELLAREGALAPSRAVQFALDACAGLSAVHAAGLIHRDLKPANFFVTRRPNGNELCKILDFGVAKGHASDVTNQGALVGTVRYMAPEQLSNRDAVSARSDVYAVGVLLFECLTGRPPHDAETPQELMFDILNRDAPRVTDIRKDVPSGLSSIVARAMSRDHTLRHRSAEELATALRPFALLGETSPSGAGTTVDGTQALEALKVPRSGGGKPLLAIAFGALALLAGIGIGSFAAVRERPPHPIAHPPVTRTPERPPPVSIAPAASLPSVPSAVPPLSAPRPQAEARKNRLAPTPGSAHQRQKDTEPPAAVGLDVKNPYEE